ncbi:MAG: thioesterase [Herbaspirillum sp.]|nr:thioesterase [Herbaspirillum sp.]
MTNKQSPQSQSVAQSAPIRNLVYTASIQIRWGDMDAIGHVNNTEYFRYMEQARIDWFTQSLGTLGDGGSGPVLVNAQCTFLRQLRYPGTVEVRIFVGAVGRSSMETMYELRRSDQPDTIYAEGRATVVWVSFSEEKSIALPEHIRARLPGGASFNDPLQK